MYKRRKTERIKTVSHLNFIWILLHLFHCNLVWSIFHFMVSSKCVKSYWSFPSEVCIVRLDTREALQFTRNVVFMEMYTQNTDVKWLILGWRWSDNVAGERMKAFSTCQLWSSVKSEVNPLTSNYVTLSFTNYQLFHMRNLSLHCYKTTFLLQSVPHHIGLSRSFTPKYAYNTRKP